VETGYNLLPCSVQPCRKVNIKTCFLEPEPHYTHSKFHCLAHQSIGLVLEVYVLTWFILYKVSKAEYSSLERVILDGLNHLSDF